MYQGSTEYPSLHLMVTDNLHFQAGKLVCPDIDAAMKRVEFWLRKNFEGTNDK
jgi:hypothetical protein